MEKIVYLKNSMKHSDTNSYGMSEEKLLELCSSKHDSKPKLFWTSEVYGFGKYIRKYGYYPSFLPLAIYTDHGVGCFPQKPWDHELTSLAPVMFYHSSESVQIWKKFSNKPCYVLYSPFVFYRRSHNIIQDKNATGTIVFPDHTIPDVDDISDTQAYIDQLKSLPKKFQPMSVCLHFHDIRIGRHKIYLKNNISVYTAGDNFDVFIERFYSILKKFKYASSNNLCSSLFYSIEMGIPFFIYGNKNKDINKSDPNYPIGEPIDWHKSKSHQTIEETFSGFDCEITENKKKIVESNLGIYNGVSRKKMAFILYTSLLRLIFSKAFYKKLISILINGKIKYGK